MLIGKLVTEIYEKKVVDLVKTEERDAERKVPVGALQEAGLSSVVDSVVLLMSQLMEWFDY